MATGNARGGTPMANEIFEASAGFLVGTGEGAQVLLGGLARKCTVGRSSTPDQRRRAESVARFAHPLEELVVQRDYRWCSAEKRAEGGGKGGRIVDPREVCGAGLDDDGRVVEQRCCFPYRGGWHHRVLVSRV
jgi:hypothetical protein